MDNTIYNLLLQDTRFLLGAETEQANRLGQFRDAATDEQLRAVLSEHAEETTQQIRRLEEMLTTAGERAEGEIPAAVDGLVEDAEFVADLELGPEVRDIAIACAGRKMEHYEIGCYETALAIARQLGLEDVASSLGETLEEERRADRRIAEVATRLIKAQAAREVERV